MNKCQLFCEYHCTHAKDNRRNRMFFMHPANPQIRKLTLTSLVMSWRFRRYMLKFMQCIVSKDHIFMNNGDNFIKLAG